MILGKGFEGKSTDRAKNAKTSKKPSRHLMIIVIRILIIIVIVFSIIATISIGVTPSVLQVMILIKEYHHLSRHHRHRHPQYDRYLYHCNTFQS